MASIIIKIAWLACVEFALQTNAARHYSSNGGWHRRRRTAESDDDDDSSSGSSWFGSSKKKENYEPSDTRLVERSEAPLQTFYMYRSQGPAGKYSYPLENVNTASLGGVLWYLHNEIIFTCHGAGGVLGSRDGGSGILGERKFHITRILRFKVQYRATTPLYRLGMNFSLLQAYDAGKATGPFRRFVSSGQGEWSQFGYTIGCGRIGEFPHNDWVSGKNYPDPIWYSLPGPCPSMDYHTATPACKKLEPGGHCPPGVVPTGEGNCTYQYEDAGEIDIDELAGITPKWPSRAEFCKECKTEGSEESKGGCGLDFWGDDIDDMAKNYEQVRKARKLFEKKYPDSPRERDLQYPPPCDFGKFRYFMSWR